MTVAVAAIVPFPGLRPFQVQDTRVFFGRETQTDELLRRLRKQRFLAVVGTSGSGKSSLVRAGMLPALYGGFMVGAGGRWRIAVLTPGNAPLENLTDKLAVPDVLGAPDGDPALQRGIIRAVLSRGELGLVEAIRLARSRWSPDENVLVVVDQFEELFTFKGSRPIGAADEAAAFVKLLLNAATDDERIFVAITMRSDYVGDCAQFADLPEAISDGLFFVPRLTSAQLRDAITGPVKVAGGSISELLTGRLLNDVGDDPDQLPVLQHALMRTWDKSGAAKSMDVPVYESIGGMRKALNQHADEIYDALPSALQSVAEMLFRTLTDKSTNELGVRRPTTVGAAAAITGASADDIRRVADAYRADGVSLLMPPLETPHLADDTVLDISHESLMRKWERLQGWAEGEAESARTYRELAESAARHERGAEDFWRDPRLSRGLAWRDKERRLDGTPLNEAWGERYAPGFARAIAFLDDSTAERDAELARLNEGKRLAETQRRRIIAFAAAAVAAIFIVAVVLTLSNYRKAAAFVTEADVKANNTIAAADRQKNETLRQARADAAVVKADAAAKIKTAKEAIAHARKVERNAVAGERLANAGAKRAVETAQAAKSAAEAATIAMSGAVRSQERAQNLEQVATLIANALDKGRAPGLVLSIEATGRSLERKQKPPQQVPHALYQLLKTPIETRVIKPADGNSSSVNNLAIAPDGSLFAGRGDGSIARFTGDGRPIGVFPPKGESNAITALALGPAGHSMVAAIDDGRVALYRDLQKPPENLTSKPALSFGPARTVAFSPDGNSVVAGGAYGFAVWDVRVDPAVGQRYEGGAVDHVAFRPAGSSTACLIDFATSKFGEPPGPATRASLDSGTISYWSLVSPIIQRGEPYLVGRMSVNSMAFSPDGSELLYSSEAGLQTIDACSKRPLRFANEGGDTTVAFRPDGRYVAVAQRNAVRFKDGLGKASALQNVDRDDASSLFESPDPSVTVTAIAFADRSRFVTGSSDGVLRVWDSSVLDTPLPARGDTLGLLRVACRRLRTHPALIDAPKTDVHALRARNVCKAHGS